MPLSILFWDVVGHTCSGVDSSPWLSSGLGRFLSRDCVGQQLGRLGFSRALPSVFLPSCVVVLLPSCAVVLLLSCVVTRLSSGAVPLACCVRGPFLHAFGAPFILHIVLVLLCRPFPVCDLCCGGARLLWYRPFCAVAPRFCGAPLVMWWNNPFAFGPPPLLRVVPTPYCVSLSSCVWCPSPLAFGVSPFCV